MNYAEKKSFEILGKSTFIGRQSMIEKIVNDIIRDTRHKIAEDIMKLGREYNKVSETKILNACHNLAISCSLDSDKI